MNLIDFSKSYFTKTDSPHHRVTDGKTSNFEIRVIRHDGFATLEP